MNLRDVASLRLRNQRVSGEHFKRAQEVVAWLGCVQSQEYPVAKWSLAQRASGFSDADVDTLLDRGAILRTHILRPTWHFVLPADIRWMMRLTGPRVAKTIRPSVDIRVPVEDAIQRALAEIRKALSGGQRMTRRQLVEVLVQHGLVTDPRETVPVFIRAELDLVVASGGLQGKVHTYALLDDIAPPAADDGADHFDRDWALGELTRRYFTSHGPATVADFVWWSGLTVGDTRRGLEINGSALERVKADEIEYWWAGDVGGQATTPRGPDVHLMQGYDEYIVAYRPPRTPLNVDGLIPPSAMSRPPFLHALVVDTQAVGWWRRVAAPGGFSIDVRLARPLGKTEMRALEAEVERHAAFVGAHVSLGQVGVATGATLAAHSEGGSPDARPERDS